MLYRSLEIFILIKYIFTKNLVRSKSVVSQLCQTIMALRFQCLSDHGWASRGHIVVVKKLMKLQISRSRKFLYNYGLKKQCKKF